MMKFGPVPGLLATGLVLVIACFVSHGVAFLERKVVNCLEDPFKCQNIYDGINYFLVSSVKSEDIDENMAAIEDWINRESSHSLSKKAASRMSALVLLRDLISTDGPGRCKPSTGQLLYANDIALREALTKLKPGQKPKRRIERIVHYYAAGYMRDCDIEARLKRFSARYMHNIRDFIGELIGRRAEKERFFMFQQINPKSFVDDYPEKAAAFAKTMKQLGTNKDIKIVRRWLNTIAVRDKDPLTKYLNKIHLKSGEIFVDGLSIYNMFRKHMAKPCEDYVDRFEALFVNYWTMEQSRKLHRSLGDESQLDQHMAYYYGCQKFLQKASQFSEGVEALMREELTAGAKALKSKTPSSK